MSSGGQDICFDWSSGFDSQCPEIMCGIATFYSVVKNEGWQFCHDHRGEIFVSLWRAFLCGISYIFFRQLSSKLCNFMPELGFLSRKVLCVPCLIISDFIPALFLVLHCYFYLTLLLYLFYPGERVSSWCLQRWRQRSVDNPKVDRSLWGLIFARFSCFILFMKIVFSLVSRSKGFRSFLKTFIIKL